MAAVDAVVLGSGQLPATIGNLFTYVSAVTIIPPGGLVLLNTSAVQQTVEIYVYAGGDVRLLERAVLDQNEKFINDVRYVLEVGDTLRGASTNAGVVNYYVVGGQEV